LRDPVDRADAPLRADPTLRTDPTAEPTTDPALLPPRSLPVSGPRGCRDRRDEADARDPATDPTTDPALLPWP
jgi:hypothetical protein